MNCYLLITQNWKCAFWKDILCFFAAAAATPFASLKKRGLTYSIHAISVLCQVWVLQEMLFPKTSVANYYTMLQKLSKCEVKAWLCYNLIILPPLRFYVKSNFGEFKRSQDVIWPILEVLNFDFITFVQLSAPNLPKFKVQSLRFLKSGNFGDLNYGNIDFT